MTRWLAVLLFCANCVGCGNVKRGEVPATCTKLGDKCQTADGPLGVCDSVECKPGEAAPCLRCIPQH